MNETIKTQAKTIIAEHPNSILITVNEKGQPTERVMWTARVDEDFTVYYATYKDSKKCKHVEANPNVLIFWYTGKGYLSLSGKAEISDDQSLRESLWRDSFAPYYPGGKNDPNYVVLKVNPGEMICVEECDAPVKVVDLD